MIDVHIHLTRINEVVRLGLISLICFMEQKTIYVYAIVSVFYGDIY